MFKINLVPEVQAKKLKIKRVNTYSTFLGIGLLGATLFLILVVGGILLAKKAELSSTENKIASVQTELDEYKELEETVLSLEKGLAGVKQIIDGEKNLSQVLNQLEKITPTDIIFKTLKLGETTIEADVEGLSIESLAKLFSSYKEYKVIRFSGTGQEGEAVTLTVDNGTPLTTKVKSTGAWSVGTTFDPTANHEITITVGEKNITANYSSETKKITSQDGAVSVEIKNLFTSLESTQYQKEGNKVKSNLKGTFEGSLVW